MPRITGGGVALFDIDNDSRLDIYLIQNAGPDSGVPNQLFHQQADGTFKNVSVGSGLDRSDFGQGVAVGDVNNDGFADIAVTEYYGGTHLMLNNGDGSFTDITQDAGIDNPLWGTSACFADFDRDGWLDLAVANYVEYDPTKVCSLKGGQREFCGPNAFRGSTSKLFRNRGGDSPASDTPRFTDISVSSGIATKPGPGLGAVCADFDGDSWPDLLIANDGAANHLWMNRKDGTFTEEGVFRGIALNLMGNPEASMGIAVGDVTGNGMFDVLTTHLTSETHSLWQQGPRGQFEDRTSASNMGRSANRSTGFGAVFADFNHDGEPDLAIANGHVSIPAHMRQSPDEDFWYAYREQNSLFVNSGQGKFELKPDDPFAEPVEVSRGLAVGDIDNDGDIDMLVTNIDSVARLFINVAPKDGHWLSVRAMDPALNRDAYGAQITITAGDRRWTNWINPGFSYVSSSDVRAHFGLGKIDKVDAVNVIWPDGMDETFPGTQVDQMIVLSKGQGSQQR